MKSFLLLPKLRGMLLASFARAPGFNAMGDRDFQELQGLGLLQSHE
jgi:hypothetical protein